MPKVNISNYNSPFAQNLRGIMDGDILHHGLSMPTSINTLATAIGATRQAVSQYRNGTVAPNMDKLCKIADYFEVSVDFLLGRTSYFKGGNPNLRAVEDETGLSRNAIDNLRSLKQSEFTLANGAKLLPGENDYADIADKFIGNQCFIPLIGHISSMIAMRKIDTTEGVLNAHKLYETTREILNNDSVDSRIKETIEALQAHSSQSLRSGVAFEEYMVQEIIVKQMCREIEEKVCA